MSPLFDTHAHLDKESMGADLGEVLARAKDAGLVGICAIGCTPESSRQSIEIAKKHPELVCAAVGIQPNYVAQAEDGWMGEIEVLAESDCVVAIGETGLDCYWDDSPLELQREYFRKHLELGKRLNKPVIIHMRESGSEILEVLEPWVATHGPVAGIMHSFTGNWELADRCMQLGLHISFAGMVTFKNAAELQHVATRIPIERLLVETDSPYLSPEPMRGKRPNEPARVLYTAQFLAQLRGVSLQELALATTQNAQTLFRWNMVPGST